MTAPARPGAEQPDNERPSDERPIGAVIFDLDGTLCDSLPDIAAAANAALEQLGLPARPLAAYRKNPGNGITDLLRNAVLHAQRETTLARTVEETTAELLPLYKAAYAKTSLQTTQLFEGIAGLLDKLTDLGLPMAVLSNKGQADVSRIAASLLARWTFAAIVGHRQGVPKKPDPTAALSIANALQLSPARCLYVGDTSVDAHTATRAEMIAVGVSWGFHPVEAQRAAGAERIATHPDQIWQWYRAQFRPEPVKA